jgi:hypothetical protein
MENQIAVEVIQAANFVTGALLISLGILIIISAILLINNMFTRFWRPIKIFTYIAAKISPEDAAAMEASKEQRKPQPTLIK